MLKEQGRKFEEQERKMREHLKEKLSAQEKQYETKLEKKLKETMRTQEKMYGEKSTAQEKRLRDQTLHFQKGITEKLEDLKKQSWKFTMDDFSIEKAKNKYDDWKSPPMYTHPCGYKFCVGIDANGCGGLSIRK